jgi:hypothetical protein
MRSPGVECAKIPASLRHETCGHHRHLHDGMAIRELFSGTGLVQSCVRAFVPAMSAVLSGVCWANRLFREFQAIDWPAKSSIVPDYDSGCRGVELHVTSPEVILTEWHLLEVEAPSERQRDVDTFCDVT